MMKTDSQGVCPNSVSSLLNSNCDETESAATLSGRSCAKRKNERNDEISNESSRKISVETAGEPKRLRLETPKYTNEERQRVAEILEREFNKELQTREEEAMLIEERIQRAQRTLQYLCYAVVSDFYSRDKTITQQVTSTRQRRIHPAVKELLAGKHPKDSTQASSSSTVSLNQPHNLFNNIPSQGKATRTPVKTKKNTANSTSNSESSSTTAVTKVPRYIPPKPKECPGKTGGSSRGAHNKVKQRIVIGNVSKWLPSESREDSATHKWMVYVRGPKDAPDVSGFVDKVRFFLHPSYRPNDVVQVVQAPFHLSRRGWGEFPVRVQIHFHDPLNKPVDVIHNLKLDRTCTGLQTLGAETVVDVWINKNNYIRTVEQPNLMVLSPVSQELEEILPQVENDDADVFCLPALSPPPNTSLYPATAIKTETMSPAASNEEYISSVVSSFLHTKPYVSESSNIRNDFVSTPKKTDCDGEPGILVSSPSKGLRPSSNIVPSPSKVLLKAATSVSSVLVSSPSVAQLKPAAPVVSSGAPASSSSAPVVSSVLVSSPSKVLPKPNTPGLVVSSPASAQVKSIPGVSGNPSLNQKVLTLNRLPLNSKQTITSAIRSDVVLSSSTSNVIPANATKLLAVPRASTVPNRLTEALQSKPPCSVAGNATKIVQPADSPKILIPSGSGQAQFIKVVSPAKSVQNPNMSVSGLIKTLPNCVTTVVTMTNTVSPVKAVQVPVAAKPAIPQRQSVVPITKTVDNPAKPISLVKYKAPDGSIRFLQVSQINTPKPAQIPFAQVTQSPPIPRPALVRPNEVKPSFTPVQRNPSPVIRLPTPSNVTPTQNQGHVLMFRDGKIYLVRPSPTVTTTGASASQVLTVRQPTPQTVVPRMPQPIVRQPTPHAIVRNPQPTNALPVLSVQKQGVQHLDKEESSVFVPPVLPSTITSMPALVNCVKTAPTSKLTPEKMVLIQRPRGPPVAQRPGVSLLKSNVLQQSPASSPGVSPVNSPCSSPMPSPSAKSIPHRVILPRPAVSPVSSSTYRTKLYKQMLSTAVRSCPTKSCAGGVGRAIRWMVRNLPLISSEARNSEYQVLHPYCSPDTNTFLSWNLGKQRACELMRAQTVWRLLQDVGWDESEIWTVREILIWARFHGYTPGLPLTDSGSDIDSSKLEEICNYKPIDEEVTQWLTKHETSHLTESVDAESSEEELDVVSVNLSPSKVRVKPEPPERTSNCLTDPVEDIPLEEPLLGSGAFVNEVLNNIGIQLEPEQLVTAVRYPAAQRILVQAVQSLIDDIVRRSLAKAWGPNISRSPRSIELPHVCSAILSRPEFDFLSCAELGVNSVPPTPGGSSTSKTNPLNPS